MRTREATRETIVDAAAGLFLQRGIGPVAMGDIAVAADCTRRNLYRYFAAKEDLVFEVVIRLMEDWNSDQTVAFSQLRGTGLKKTGDFLLTLASHLEHQKPLLRLMGEFDFTFRDDSVFHPSLSVASRFAQAAHITETLLENLVREGIADGSIRADTDVPAIVPTITTVLWGTGQRIAIRDRMTQEEFGLSGMDLIRTQIKLYIQALAA